MAVISLRLLVAESYRLSAVGRLAAGLRSRALVLGLGLGVGLGIGAADPLAARAVTPELADRGAVILVYHRFGEGDHPSTNITLEQFDAHLAILTSGRYDVRPLPEIVAALAEGRPLPPRTVGISIDDAYLSVWTEAWPRLSTAGLPFTLFVATDSVDRETPRSMTWSQLRELAASPLVTIGSQTASHPHMPEQSPERNRQEILRSHARFERELGSRPSLFAYPFGEFSLAVRDLVATEGFRAAFGQHSGAAGHASDPFRLPRFALNEAYGTPERFSLVVETLPLPALDITPDDPLIGPNDNPPAYGFTVPRSVGSLNGLQCYAGRGNEARLQRLDRRIEVRFAAPLRPGRTRVNCTMPGPDGRWRWLGRQFYLPAR
ncbi:polysaccharide deacetylase family protein [Algihabitans albus]|uniref:polysaccharide deacetylase family protein n=1 Tax=Algihabitans albus TaxID=2164067 RepID=UPI000E5C9267|nr:polysaccharide deacetylase family protein [Algihabitans albus]